MSFHLGAQARDDYYLGSPAIKERKNHLSLHVGFSLPQGEFASTNASYAESGYALPGSVLHINYTYFLSENIGFVVQWGASSNPVDEQAYLSAIRSYLPQGRFAVAIDDYTSTYLLFGFKLQTDDNPHWHIGPMLGSVGLNVPAVHVNQQVSGRPDLSGSITTGAASDGAIAYGAFGGLDYKLTERFGMNLTASYMRADFEVESTGLAIFQNGSSFRYSNKYKQPYEIISIACGVIFSF